MLECPPISFFGAAAKPAAMAAAQASLSAPCRLWKSASFSPILGISPRACRIWSEKVSSRRAIVNPPIFSP